MTRKTCSEAPVVTCYSRSHRGWFTELRQTKEERCEECQLFWIISWKTNETPKANQQLSHKNRNAGGHTKLSRMLTWFGTVEHYASSHVGWAIHKKEMWAPARWRQCAHKLRCIVNAQQPAQSVHHTQSLHHNTHILFRKLLEKYSSFFLGERSHRAAKGEPNRKCKVIR